MIDISTAIAAACAGFAAGWICKTALERRQAYWLDYCRRRIPPQQPLTANLIRYWQWQDEQVRQALKEDNNSPPGDAP